MICVKSLLPGIEIVMYADDLTLLIFLYITIVQSIIEILSFRNGSAAGIDGLSPQHLKDHLSINNGVTEVELL